MAERDRQQSRQGDPDEGFFRRWSRRKAGARGADKTPPEDPGAVAEGRPAPVVESSPPAQGEPAPVAPEELPDIESLDANSDFTVFMRPGVPEHLRTLALRKMWRTDPIFSKLDGLVEYGEDYTIQSWPTGAIRTAYQIGRGFVNELERLGEAKTPPETTEAASTSAAPPGAANTSAEANQPGDAGPRTPESGAESTEARIEPRSTATSIPAKPRARPLPRRG